MGDRPILFSAPMVRALLDGRKTQTRRVLKAEIPADMYPDSCHYCDSGWGLWRKPDGPCTCREVKVPYFESMRLWVRETFRTEAGGVIHDGAGGQMDYVEPRVVYGADEGLTAGRRGQLGCVFRPSIHMPRWASRLTLTVTNVRVQRLQEISEADCIAESCRGLLGPNPDFPDEWDPSPQEEFRDLWNTINGPGAWDANPWVVALTFTVERRNIDAHPEPRGRG